MPTQELREDTSHDSSATPHQIEHEVHRSLCSRDDIGFTSLVVRRIDNGVCLEGFVETDAQRDAVNRLAAQVAGVNDVLNRLVVRHACPNKD